MRRLPAWLWLATALLPAVPARAQTEVTSAAPDHVSVTLYRSSNRSSYNPEDFDAKSPQGYALITETRTVTVPAGVAVIRFEGVAGNIMPETALITGLPYGVQEKNLDASLLSPRSLFDRALGRRVMVKRTDPATGKVVLVQATLRSGVDGAAVLQFANNEYSDLRCSGMPEMLVYDGIPQGLSARPTLSVRTVSAAPRRVTLTLSYLAGGFDWQANYVVAMAPDRRSADMFAWITLASTDVTSFPDADLQVVAGKINRAQPGDDEDEDEDSYDSEDDFGPQDGDLSLKCWSLPQYDLAMPAAPAPPPPPSPMMSADNADIVITGSKVRSQLQFVPLSVSVIATAEQLGDLKLYRFPRRVTVASNGQKQVGMLNKPSVKLAPVYRSRVNDDDADTELLLRGKNVTANGLGVPLPGGHATILATVAGRALVIGESWFDDKTIGEDVELSLGEPDDDLIEVEVEELKDHGRKTNYVLTVTNKGASPIDYEAQFGVYGSRSMRTERGKLGRKDGLPLWTVKIPAHGKVELRYTVTRARQEDNDD